MGFAAAADGGVLVDLDPVEAGVLEHLLGQMVGLVESDESGSASDGQVDELAAMVGIGTSTQPPLDPALARLFPDAYRGDSVAAGDFRRFTEERLRARKLEHAATVLAAVAPLAAPGSSVDPILVPAAEVPAWLGALNDVRLVLGTRLDVQEDDDPDEWLAGPDADAYRLYHWLGYLQDDLLTALGAGAG